MDIASSNVCFFCFSFHFNELLSLATIHWYQVFTFSPYFSLKCVLYNTQRLISVRQPKRSILFNALKRLSLVGAGRCWLHCLKYSLVCFISSFLYLCWTSSISDVSNPSSTASCIVLFPMCLEISFSNLGGGVFSSVFSET